jgi:hypothetical protein
MIDDFYAFYDFYGFSDLPLTAYRLEEMRNDVGLGINVAQIIQSINKYTAPLRRVELVDPLLAQAELV